MKLNIQHSQGRHASRGRKPMANNEWQMKLKIKTFNILRAALGSLCERPTIPFGPFESFTSTCNYPGNQNIARGINNTLEAKTKQYCFVFSDPVHDNNGWKTNRIEGV